LRPVFAILRTYYEKVHFVPCLRRSRQYPIKAKKEEEKEEKEEKKRKEKKTPANYAATRKRKSRDFIRNIINELCYSPIEKLVFGMGFTSWTKRQRIPYLTQDSPPKGHL